MMDVVRSHPELRIMGSPTFCFSFTSDAFDIYHVADFMRPRGWRFNGQQYPNAIHMAVTRPQTQPGVVDAFAADLAEAVELRPARGRRPARRRPSPGAIYGGVAGGLTSEVEDFIVMFMDAMLDAQQALPPVRRHDRAGRRPFRRLVLAVDLGSGGPKVGYVTLTGEPVWWWYERCRPPSAAPRSRTPRCGGTRSCEIGPARAGRGGPRRAGAWWAWASPGSGPAPCPVDDAGRPVGECLMWSDTRGVASTPPTLFGGPVAGYAPRPLATWLRRCRGASRTRPAPTRVAHMLHLERDRPEVTAAGPLVPRAGGLPDHAVHRCAPRPRRCR